MEKRVLIAMSGGLDSATAAFLLQEQGYALGGATLLLYHNEAGCEEARTSAARLGISHTVVDATAAFAREVIDRFADTYHRGETPNPCVDCNIHVKFGLLVPYALAHGYDFVASGHYARTETAANGRTLLRKGLDPGKDQSYVLYGLDQHILSHLLLPLGGLSKKQAREFAAAHGYADASLPESQDICFVPDGDYAAFIAGHDGRPVTPGDFLDADGHRLGSHRGQLHYTIGQRRGLGVGFGRPLYVVAKDAARNTVTLGDEPQLYSSRLITRANNLIAEEKLTAPLRCAVKTRYRQQEQPATIEQTGADEITVCFDQPQKAIAAGQSAVFYADDYVLGGGKISGAEPRTRAN